MLHELRQTRSFDARTTLRAATALALALALAGCAASGGESARAPQGGMRTADAPAIPQPQSVVAEPIPAAPPAPAAAPVYAPPPAAPAPMAIPPAAPTTLPPAVPAPAAAAPVVHTVQKGDTVYSLGRRYGVKPDQIRDANGLGADYGIKVGQKLTIPSSGPSASYTPTPAPAAPAAPMSPDYSTAPQAMIRPVEGAIITRFGAQAGSSASDGVDISAQPGAIVRAATDGSVTYVSQPKEHVGSVILIKHAGGYTTVYGRVEHVAVRVGQQVVKGAPLARVARPSSGGARLHFELRRGSQPIDPTPYI